jgi:hypothetical protein
MGRQAGAKPALPTACRPFVTDSRQNQKITNSQTDQVDDEESQGLSEVSKAGATQMRPNESFFIWVALQPSKVRTNTQTCRDD